MLIGPSKFVKGSGKTCWEKKVVWPQLRFDPLLSKLVESKHYITPFSLSSAHFHTWGYVLFIKAMDLMERSGPGFTLKASSFLHGIQHLLCLVFRHATLFLEYFFQRVTYTCGHLLGISGIMKRGIGSIFVLLLIYAVILLYNQPHIGYNIP